MLVLVRRDLPGCAGPREHHLGAVLSCAVRPDQLVVRLLEGALDDMPCP